MIELQGNRRQESALQRRGDRIAGSEVQPRLRDPPLEPTAKCGCDPSTCQTVAIMQRARHRPSGSPLGRAVLQTAGIARRLMRGAELEDVVTPANRRGG